MDTNHAHQVRTATILPVVPPVAEPVAALTGMTLAPDIQTLVHHAVAGERLRIARELHDIVAYAVTAMALQAAGASRVVAADPGRAAQAMESVAVLGQQAIVELRRMLAMLRAGDDRDMPSSRCHGVAEIPTLLRGFESSGVSVLFESLGRERHLEPNVNLAAYRLVQESVTNAAKHADGAQVEVVVSWRADSIDLEVANEIPERRAPVGGGPSGGYGLVGLRERVRLVGGTFTAMPSTDGRFVVSASLPTAGSDRIPAAFGTVSLHACPCLRGAP